LAERGGKVPVGKRSIGAGRNRALKVRNLPEKGFPKGRGGKIGKKKRIIGGRATLKGWIQKKKRQAFSLVRKLRQHRSLGETFKGNS